VGIDAQLYLHAEQEGVEGGRRRGREVTVHDVYCEALLLSLTDPTGWCGELDKVIGPDAQLARPRDLHSRGPATRHRRGTSWCRATDRPPKPMIGPQEDAGGPNWRLLDANAVVDRVRAKKQARETATRVGHDEQVWGSKGLMMLGAPWRHSGAIHPSGQLAPQTDDSSVAICVGIKAVTHFVSFEPRMDAAPRPKP
jgi:hypothetical protein